MQESGCECVLGMRERVKVGEGFEGTCKCEPVCVFVGAGLVRVTAYECVWVGVCVCGGGGREREKVEEVSCEDDGMCSSAYV